MCQDRFFQKVWAASQHSGTSLLNKVTWTVGKKLSLRSWQIQTSLALKLLWQLPCLCKIKDALYIMKMHLGFMFFFFTFFIYFEWIHCSSFFTIDLPQLLILFIIFTICVKNTVCTFIKILIKIYICYLVFTILLEHSQEPNKGFFFKVYLWHHLCVLPCWKYSVLRMWDCF